MSSFRTILATTTVATLSAMGLVACGDSTMQQATTMEEMGEITLSVADIDPEGGVYNNALKVFMEEAESASDGQITFEMYSAGSLMPGGEMLQGVRVGTADIGRIISFYFPNELPASNWLTDLGNVKSDSYPHGLIESALSGQRLHMMDGPVKDEFEAYNLVPLVDYPTAQAYDLLCTRPVESAADAEGLRVRTGGALHVNEVEAMGMVPVDLPVTEMYEGLQRGIVDCAALNLSGHINYSLWEVAPYYVPTAMSQLNMMPVVMNKDRWDSLPPEAQEILRDAATASLLSLLEEFMGIYQRFAVEGPESHDIEFMDSSELDDKLVAFQEQRVDNARGTAPEGVDGPALISEIEESNAQWRAFLEEEMGVPVTDRDPSAIRNSYIDAGDLDLQPLWDEIESRDFSG
ncbi:C4-dicarboxylate TRAP transporter substrate-binding protein [Corynebacterium sp.]|uniref:C4-dicarboxylate TRAP transporter substrate-binding protein n=1 Tax=Corynebacterium sp. TaxID=1720 RepID=UPI0026E0C334|nr:C4-dicarboxylate TRAP transporter substrate-binding protein [Corynebacterium sp.]MDO5511736.1 C4-dicarboxylate TRAP transporter substrate-binding protein [Corynebacterium sp.]